MKTYFHYSEYYECLIYSKITKFMRCIVPNIYKKVYFSFLILPIRTEQIEKCKLKNMLVKYRYHNVENSCISNQNKTSHIASETQTKVFK